MDRDMSALQIPMPGPWAREQRPMHRPRRASPRLQHPGPAAFHQVSGSRAAAASGKMLVDFT